MARTAFYAPAHRVMGRIPLGSGGAGQPAVIGPSFDACFIGLQDARYPWNSGFNAAAPQVIGHADLGAHPVIDLSPSTASIVSIAPAAAGAVGPMTLVTSTGAGITVSSSALLTFPFNVTIPSGTLFIDGVLAYNKFGLSNQQTWAYSAATMLGRCVAIHSAGNDTAATATVAGWDIYGAPTTSTVTLGNNATVNTTKAFKAVKSITLAGTLSGSNVGAGQADIFGLPIFALVQSGMWGYFNNLILQGTGTFVAGDTTAPATALTGDVRGTLVPGSASDGTKRLTLWQHVAIAQLVSSGINIGTFGQPQV
jgi:hypothetical protein